MNTDITGRVERGAALLDEKRPGWWRGIDLSVLDIRSPCGCVLGQLGTQLGDSGYLSGFATGLEVLHLEPRQARDYGFDWGVEVTESMTEHEADRLIGGETAALTEVWHALITRRRELAGAVS